MGIEIFVLTYNRNNFLKQTLETIFLQTDSNFYLTIIDNGSNKENRVNPLDYNFQFRLIRNDINLSFNEVSNQIKDIEIMRKKIPSASSFYGQLYFNHTQEDLFSVPNNGFNSYLDSNVLPEIIKETNTNISLKIFADKTGFRLTGSKALNAYDKIIWTGNPNPILKCLNLPKLDSHNLRCEVLVGEISAPIRCD